MKTDQDILESQYFTIKRRLYSNEEFEQRYLIALKVNGKEKVIRKINSHVNSLNEVLKEAIILKRIKCDNLCQNVEDYYIQNKSLFLVMNYYGQDTLESYLDDLKKKQKQLDIGTVKKWIMDLTFTIDYLHKHNQAHGKILKNNIFIKDDHLVLGELSFKCEYPILNESIDKLKEYDLISLRKIIIQIFEMTQFHIENEIQSLFSENCRISDVLKNIILFNKKI